MPLRFFAIPALAGGEHEAELNRLLAAGKVLALDRQFVADGSASFWAVCVTLGSGDAHWPAELKASAARRIDYRQVLDEADFALFARLRALRKQVAETESVPPYAVFTNEQLADMVRQRVSNRDELARIDGVGAARVERYGYSEDSGCAS